MKINTPPPPKYKAVILHKCKPTDDIRAVSAIDFLKNEVQLAEEAQPRSMDSILLLPFSRKKDRNGTDVYLGDLVRCSLDNFIRVVDWHEEDSGYVLRQFGEVLPKFSSTFNPSLSCCADNLFFSDTVVEVVGNIYDGTLELDERPFIQYY